MRLITYTNARGEETVLDDTERTFIGELYGREGTEAPSLQPAEIVYADGSSDVIAVNIQPRDVTLYFWAPAGSQSTDRMLQTLKQRLIQTGAQEGEWGKLMIRRRDGRPLYLTCVYTGGLDELVRESWGWIKFALTFHAQDPYFHDDFETTYTLAPAGSMLYFGSDLFMKSNLYMNSNLKASRTITVEGERVYPKIIVHGPAQNIRILNKTTGKQIELSSSVSLSASQQITIITEPRNRSIKRGSTSLIRYLTESSSLNFFLERGANELEFYNTASGPQSWMKISFMEQFLSCE